MKTVIITGASGGLGEVLGFKFKEAGYGLILQHCYHPINSNLQEGSECVQGNLRMFTTLNEIVQLAELKKANILINNAASYLNKSFDIMTDCEIKEVIETNLLAPMILTRKLWNLFKQNNGIIININSIAGKEGGVGETAYSASKHGLFGFSKALQFDATKDNINILDVFIGRMSTNMTAGQLDQYKYINPMEVAQAIYEFCILPQSTCRIKELTIMRRNY